MRLTRRNALKLLAGAVPAMRTLAGGLPEETIQPGPFKGTRESLTAYRIPEWFRDAKFGIWAHWGPQSATGAGDWYARLMYIQGERQYKHHVEHYGHPSKVGYKDIIPTWKAERFDPNYLVDLYKKAGARYFVSMGAHHDNFDLWNSTHQRWNSVNMGPKRDIVGEFRKAARAHGLPFGVSEHLWVTYKWFSVSKGTDKEGPLAGVPYDGADGKTDDLYCSMKDADLKLDWDETLIADSWKRQWFLRVKDLVDKYEPDYLYSDGGIPFEEIGLSLVAHYYNKSAKRHRGRPEVVYLSKDRKDSENGGCVLDVERGLVEGIWPHPWQTDTCVGNWHYLDGATYKSPKTIVDLLVDIVSRNGNLMLNFPLPGSGMLDDAELKILSEITKWMAVNGEAIHATRPWTTFGDGPVTRELAAAAGKFSESKRKDLSPDDYRFTTRGRTLYAFVMGWPGKQAVIPPLGAGGKIEHVELLGYGGKLKWTRDDAGLKIELPAERPCDYAIAFKITGLI